MSDCPTCHHGHGGWFPATRVGETSEAWLERIEDFDGCAMCEATKGSCSQKSLAAQRPVQEDSR